MRLFLPLGMAAGMLTFASMPPVQADPFASKVSLMGVAPYTQGVEAEIGLGDSPFILGGQCIYLWSGRETTPWAPLTPQAGGRQQWSAWVGYRKPLTQDSTVGVLAGAHQSWEAGVLMPSSVIQHESRGLVGMAYERTWSSLRLRVQPTFLVNPQDWVYLPWFGVLAKSAVFTGIPWVEVGYRVLPNTELSLRASLTPVALSLIF